ncbi:hypothetical protein [Apilactobacillus xinyiensis]|uniref:hypothetical protein n=1 Tax=Apilactobacillus xinyiensis TaxID=2841032 RepID=UPI00200DEBBA|nr:hypothetical protein [Apilactobacillus xinyiensis]MCL0330640.1 hypothetical protein [Apilactobacillus xinyiensis]
MFHHPFNENNVIGEKNGHYSGQKDFVVSLSKKLCKAYEVDFDNFEVKEEWIANKLLDHKDLLHEILTAVIDTAHKTQESFKLHQTRG